jgi:hypothetical protein
MSALIATCRWRLFPNLHPQPIGLSQHSRLFDKLLKRVAFLVADALAIDREFLE